MAAVALRQGPPIPVLIVGGGPIGLALAAELGRRGVAARLVERRTDGVGTAKMIVVSVRTMELCRQLGVAGDVRDWGFPLDQPLDSVFCTALDGHEIGRVRAPPLSVQADTPFSPERERPCPQTWFDPILQRHARRFPHVTLSYETALTGFAQDAEGVTAELDDGAGGRETVRADYLVGCDGFGSTVRERLGIALRGNPCLDRSMSIYVRSAALRGWHGLGDAYRYVCVDERGPWAVLTTMDGRDLWRVQLIGREVEVPSPEFAALFRRMVGRDVPYEVENVSTWVRKMTVADRFADGRVFLAGDAAHAHPPNGGLGMNTGIQDAFDLGWKLAAMRDGWGGGALLDSYDLERRPASARAAEESLRNYRRLTAVPHEPDALGEGQAAAAARSRLGALLEAENAKAWNALGVHLGYSYDPSPIVVPDGTPRPADDPEHYAPSARPGALAPHATLADGRCMLDLFGEGFTLLAFGDAVTWRLEAAARGRALPLTVHRLGDEGAAAHLYGRRLVLVRPDGHVAWRGDDEPADPDGLMDTVRGAGLRAASCRAGEAMAAH